MGEENSMKSRGSILVEAALIFPVIILVIVAMIYILVYMYHQTCLQSVINMVSERKGYYLAGSILTEDLVPENRLYYYFYRNSDLIENIEPCLKNYYQKYTLSRKQKIKMSFSHHLMYSQMEVIAYDTYSIPFLNHTDTEIRKRIKAVYYVHDEAEYVRNVDLVLNESFSEIDDIFEKAVQRSERIGKD